MLNNKINNLLQAQVQCVLATHKENTISQHLMAYSFSADLKYVYFISFSATQKVVNILSNNNVSVLWDNRTGNTSDHIQGFSMTGLGKAKVIPIQSGYFNRSDFLKRNPNLEALLNDEDCVCISLKIYKYIWVEGYKKVSVLQLD